MLVDLSGIIFVVVAAGWGIYLLPKAVRRHDEHGARPVDSFSDSVRVVGRTGATQAAPVAQDAPAAPRRHTITRAAARQAAQRRRRVLGLLLLALLATVGTSYFAVTPWWSTAIPAALVLVFLVVARVTVRAQQARREAAAPEAIPAPADAMPVVIEPDLGAEDTAAISREELAAAVADPIPDDGGLWDPLPMTLPTYVHKARAHRTVRTIELTHVTSSGHDAADTALARQAEEARQAEDAGAAEAEKRKAAGA